MKTLFLGVILVFVLTSETLFVRTATAQANSTKELAGLWQAKRRFGPDVRGALLIKQTGGTWQAEIAGRVATVKLAGAAIAFELPNGEGSFQGKFDPRQTTIAGHWIQPATVENDSPYASPVTPTKDKQNMMSGFHVTASKSLFRRISTCRNIFYRQLTTNAPRIETMKLQNDGNINFEMDVAGYQFP